jgi:DNA-binding response OmpR family regulator
MLVMEDKDTAHILPGNGNLGALSQALADNFQSYAHSVQKEAEKSEASGHILIVEDDPSLASLEAGVLTASGYTVTIERDGELALLAFQRSIPDLVVLDLELSGTMSGWDVLQALRTYSKVPVLLTSSFTTVRERIRTRSESRLTLDHLPKPYSIQTLLKCIERMLVIVPQ